MQAFDQIQNKGSSDASAFCKKVQPDDALQEGPAACCRNIASIVLEHRSPIGE